MSNTTQPWQIAAAAEISQDKTPALRASASGQCERRLTYAAQGAPESNPPDEAALNIMALGNMAEILIIQALHSRGWETEHTVLSPAGQLELIIPIPETDQVITGHPDGICRHPELTRNLWVTLECKSMSYSRGQQVEELGIKATYPHYISQIALYAQRLHEMELVSYPRHGVFAMMTREGQILPAERITWDQDQYDQTIDKLAVVVKAARTGRLPERPYPSTSRECKYCSYHATCWGQPPTRDDIRNSPTTRIVIEDDEAVVEAARTYGTLKAEVDKARDTLREACRNAGNADIEAEGYIAGYFLPKGDTVYDHRLLREKVPADLLRQCAITNAESPEPAFWIRPKKR